MPELQYLVFTNQSNAIALKAEAQRLGDPLLEFNQDRTAYSMRVSGFIQEPWKANANPRDHLDFYVSQDLVDVLETEVQNWGGPSAPQQFQAANPRWSAAGSTRLFYVFDRSEIPGQQIVIALQPGVHGSCTLLSNEIRLFVDREVPQRRRGFRARLHFGVVGEFERTMPVNPSSHNYIDIILSQDQARMVTAAVQYAIDQHRARNR